MVCCWDEPPHPTPWDGNLMTQTFLLGITLSSQWWRTSGNDERNFCANCVSTAQMAHCETQLAPRSCSNRGGQEHAERRLSLGACERGVSRRRRKSATSGYSVRKLSNWGKSSWVKRCKRHCSLESSHVLPCLFRRSKACNWSQQM